MKTIPKKTERIHSLDSLRVIMMLLGLVIHAAVTYGIVDYGNLWPLKDPVAMHRTVIIPSFIVNWAIPATLKFLFVAISSGVICFVTYHYFVRATFIGKFLNGRKYSRKISDLKEKRTAAPQPSIREIQPSRQEGSPKLKELNFFINK